jgi:hypothetical protein
LLRLIFLVPAAYVAALVAGAVVVSVGLFGRSFFDLEVVGYAGGAVVASTLVGGAISFVPALIGIIVAEAFGWRSVLFWLGVGGVCGIIAAEAARATGGLDFVDNRFTLCLAAGFTGGFVYWLIAGRDSGASPPRSSATTR